MKSAELKNNIIKRILDVNDKGLLDYLDLLLARNESSETYKLSSFEKQIIKESLADYEMGNTNSNDDIYTRNSKWLNE